MKCPRCNNSNLRDDYKYCPICGLKIEFKTYSEAIEFLKTIKTTSRGFIIPRDKLIDFANFLNYEFSQIGSE